MLENIWKKCTVATMGTRVIWVSGAYGGLRKRWLYYSNKRKAVGKILWALNLHFRSKCLSFVDKNSYLDMPNLFLKLINEKFKTSVYKIDGYWLILDDTKSNERANIDV